jgi:hypothetical protein
MRAAMALAVLATCGALGTEAGLLGRMARGAAGAAVGTAAASAKERKVYDTTTLAPGALRNCMQDAYLVDSVNAQVDIESAALEKDRDELKRSAQALRGKPATDKRVVEYRSQEKAFNARVDAVNAKVATTSPARERFKSNCIGKKYYDSDMQAVLAQLPPDARKLADKK